MDRSAIATTGSAAVAIALSTLATAGATAMPRIDGRYFAPLRSGALHVWSGGAMTETGGERVVVLSMPPQSSSLVEEDGELVTLTEMDFAILTDADIEMLEFALGAEPDDLDYSALYDHDDD